MAKHLLQISATNSQVRQKTADMLQLLRQLQEPQQSYCLLQICNKILLQCESQVTKLPSFAFPFAEVIVACCTICPPLYGLVVASLAKVRVPSPPRHGRPCELCSLRSLPTLREQHTASHLLVLRCSSHGYCLRARERTIAHWETLSL